MKYNRYKSGDVNMLLHNPLLLDQYNKTQCNEKRIVNSVLFTEGLYYKNINYIPK